LNERKHFARENKLLQGVMGMKLIEFNKDDCQKVRQYLDFYIDSELTTETSFLVSKHLEKCQRCSTTVDNRQHIKHRLKSAVLQDTASPQLHAKIEHSIRQQNKASQVGWILAAAATLVLAFGAWAAIRVWNSPDRITTQAFIPGEDVLKIGLSDHVHCAILSDFANRQFTDPEMIQKMGPEYAGLLSLVREKVSEPYRIVVGHRCRVNGREMVHMILKDKDMCLSLVITKKNGESFSESGLRTVLKTAGLPLYQSNMDDLEVTGFETRDHLAFVVSGLAGEENLTIASSLAPAVRDFLVKLEA
jgi:anti-sigma factor (TIGR02949 family)